MRHTPGYTNSYFEVIVEGGIAVDLFRLRDRDSEQLTSILVDLTPARPGFGMPTGIDGDFGQVISAVLIGDRIENRCD